MLIELGGASDDALVAAALLWRVFYSRPTLPLGAITLGRFRKANPEVSAALAARLDSEGRRVLSVAALCAGAAKDSNLSTLWDEEKRRFAMM